VSQWRVCDLCLRAMVIQSTRVLLVGLVLGGVLLNGTTSSHQAPSLPKLRYIPLATAYRQEIREKIEAPSHLSSTMPIGLLTRPTASPCLSSSDKIGRLALCEDTTIGSMSLLL
jgi:hypothetical protein